MMIEEFQKLVIEKPYTDLKKFKTYGDSVEIDYNTIPVNDIEDIRAVLEEQCEKSLLKIRDIRGEIPVAIHFFLQSHPTEKNLANFAWQAWTKKP